MVKSVTVLILEKLLVKCVIDYVLASPALFPDICHFEVLPFNDIFSDIHCPFRHVEMRRNISKYIHDGIKTVDNSDKQIQSNWKQEYSNVFSTNIGSSKVSELYQLIEINNRVGMVCKLLAMLAVPFLFGANTFWRRWSVVYRCTKFILYY